MCILSLPSKKTLVSSANNIAKSNLDELVKSFICKINSSGPKIEPCGTPYSICWVLESQPL